MAALFLLGALSIFVTSFADIYVSEFTVKEQEPPGTYIGNIPESTNLFQKANISQNVFNRLKYSFRQPDNKYNHVFSINNVTGDLFLSTTIDREGIQKCRYLFHCVLTFDVAANDGADEFKIVTVNILIQDINDNAPQFPEPAITINISESSDVGYLVHLPAAVDLDTWGNNGVQTYEIFPTNGTFGLVTTNVLDGSIDVKLRLQERLDREKTAKYILQIFATDGGAEKKTGKLQVDINVLDDNDNPPVFSESIYNLTVSEDTQPGTTILAVTATDKDSGMNGEVEYHISQQAFSDIFSINPKTGDISLLKKLVYEPNEIFSFFVEARDKGTIQQYSETKVNIQVEPAGNNPPVIKLHMISGRNGVVPISELANLNVPVAYMSVEDSDNGNNGYVTCTISSSYFELQALSSKSFKVVVKRLLDRERVSQHTVTVTCRDLGTPSLQSSVHFLVRVVDENDNTPTFVQPIYLATMRENNPVGTDVIQVSANDDDVGMNAKIRYALLNDAGSYFSIDGLTGIVYATKSLDREMRSDYEFRVLAVDSGNPPQTGTATVIVNVTDVNDNPPIFSSSYAFKAITGSDTYTPIGIVTARDLDVGLNGFVQYSMSSQYMNVPFEVLRNGTIITSTNIDGEFTRVYNFMVDARDSGTPSLNSSAYVSVYVFNA